jgi:glutaredoxin 2
VNEKLAGLPSLLKGKGYLKPWGWGMDDVLLLPWLQRLTWIKGIVLPKEVQDYMMAPHQSGLRWQIIHKSKMTVWRGRPRTIIVAATLC